MAHRSNQAVASQGEALPQAPDEPPRPRRLLVGWATALVALAVSTVLLGFGLWLVRASIAEFFLGAALAERGAEADFQVVNLDLNGATLRDVRFGSLTEPDALVPTIEARWTWRGLSPQIRSLRLIDPQIRLRMDGAGRISAGSLDRIGGAPGRRRFSIPRIELEIVNGRATINAPFGPLEATFLSTGTIGRDFAARAQITETSRLAAGYALSRGAGELIVVSRDENVALQFDARADTLLWEAARLDGASVRLLARAPLDIARYDFELTWRADALRTDVVSAIALTGAAGFEALARETELAPAQWEGEAHARSATLQLGDSQAMHASFDLHTQGEGARGEGRWTLGAQSFAGLAMVSANPSAAGAFRFELKGNETFTGDARVALAQTRLNAEAQDDLRAVFPDIPDAPIGPTFAQAEHALDAAADRFDFTVPLAIDANEQGVHIRIAAPAEARATTGATLRFSPLRQDAPALVLQWPGPQLHGSIAVELSGGGAPNASLLLDTMDWQPNEPFDADGTLTLANWHAAGASIAAGELGVSISIAARGGGQIELRGPTRITGPIGDGEVRDLVADMNIAVTWSQGWRVAQNGGCLPMRLGGLDVAGLSFANGAFGLCALDGALIAADAQRNLSGGFSIQQLALNGRMAGPAAQPARLSAGNVVGRFRGRTGNLTLALQAEAPRLAIDMAEGRTLSVLMQRITADAHVADSWRIDGAFESGELNDPALPGSVSTIAGRWEAAPEDGKPVIRVEAGEAMLIANRPATDAERPLFNPLRLVDVDAMLREGRISADGAIVLAERAQRLARFDATHDVDAGTGAANVVATDIVFDQTLQPYDITERARGLVENVRGPASLNANIVWTRDALTSTGRVGLNGISLATSTIPVVNDVRGEIYFDDLFALTTPPGQQVRVGLLNPGIAVENGRVRFQLLPEQRVSIEQAEFDFASGILAMSPTTITLGADETRFALTLRDVEAADLLTTLNTPDLTATGTIQGTFPLLLTRRTAFIENGVLRASEGGTLAYTGNAGQSATGPARIAFEALQNFRYDNLEITLNGDLNGDVVSSIEFSGHNAGEPVDLGEITPIPGLGRVTVRGVPFDFNVRVTAPFRRLAETAASITDPSALLDHAEQPGEEEPVDPDAPSPR